MVVMVVMVDNADGGDSETMMMCGDVMVVTASTNTAQFRTPSPQAHVTHLNPQTHATERRIHPRGHAAPSGTKHRSTSERAFVGRHTEGGGEKIMRKKSPRGSRTERQRDELWETRGRQFELLQLQNPQQASQRGHPIPRNFDPRSPGYHNCDKEPSNHCR